MSQTVHTKVFIKGGGEELISLPKVLMFELAKSIQDKGHEKIHLASGKILVVTGLMIYSSEFLSEARIIVVEGKEHESSEATVIH